MPDENLGRLERVDLRSIWPTERDFSAWLAENIDFLAERLGLELELIEQEMPVGDFRVDLFGRVVGTGSEVVIENQLESTDHSHLGQLLTYAAGREAKTIVWISGHFREEHRQAIDWLNLHTDEDTYFFGVEAEVWRIGTSPPAPNLNVVSQPSDWQKQIGRPGKQPISERQLAYHAFFADLVDRLKLAAPGFTHMSRVGYNNWLIFGAGRTGFAFQPEFMRRPDRLMMQLNITTGDKAKNKRAYDVLFAEKAAIEAELGEPLEWRRLDEKIECRIGVQHLGAIDSPPELLDRKSDWAVQHLIAFRQAFSHRIKSIDLPAPFDDQNAMASDNLAPLQFNQEAE